MARVRGGGGAPSAESGGNGMSTADAYLRDLAAALGDRLPAEVRAARLAETRSHLLDSAVDVGEAEAVRRYERARSIANGLVRSHVAYDTESAWKLAFPVAVGFLSLGIATMFLRGVIPFDFGRIAMLVSLVAFAARVVQTRRWLAGPMIVAHAIGTLLVMGMNHAYRD
ncbi:hypothetical protein EON79_04455 [bacterium]|nr:MAG: hypothetical protein EON79_04455 [bacterium]